METRWLHVAAANDLAYQRLARDGGSHVEQYMMNHFIKLFVSKHSQNG